MYIRYQGGLGVSTHSKYSSARVYIYILNHNPCFNLFALHNNSFDNQRSEIN